MATAPLTVRLNPNDNVVVARLDVLPGTALAGEGAAARERIPAGHKMATRPIAKGEPVRKFGQIIGFATPAIAAGRARPRRTTARMGDFARDYAFGSDARPTDYRARRPSGASFEGYRPRQRQGRGRATIIGVLSTGELLGDGRASSSPSSFPRTCWRSIRTSTASSRITHGTGCGMADRRRGLCRPLQRTLWGFAGHPNFAGVLMVGLGCEVIADRLSARGLSASSAGPRSAP